MSPLEEDIKYIEWQMGVHLMHGAKVRFNRIVNELRGSSKAEQGPHEPQVAGSNPAPATTSQEQRE